MKIKTRNKNNGAVQGGGSKEVLFLRLRMVTESPLFTGEVRKKEAERKKDQEKIGFPIRLGKNGRVYVPFKGALRSALEILLREEGVCDTGRSNAKPCGKCVLCSLFGSLGRRARANVSFLISRASAQEIVREATHIRVNRDTGSVSDSFSGQEVVEGAEFEAEILIYDPQEEDRELINKALKFIEKNGIGGWTFKGYGRVKFEIIQEEQKKVSEFIEEG